MSIDRKKGTWVRTQYIINPRFQFRVIGYAFIASALVIGVVYASNFYFFHRFISMGKDLGIPENHVYFEFLQQQRVTMNWVFLGISSVISGILFLGGVLLSHRIAGPIYHLCRELRFVAEGRPLKEVKFRTHDFFPELAEFYSGAVRQIKEHGIKNEDTAA